MSHDYRCNRCDEIITGKRWHVTIQPRPPSWTSVNIPGPRSLTANTGRSDLCNQCKADYDVWVAGGRITTQAALLTEKNA